MLIGYSGFLKLDLEDRVILAFMVELGRPKGRYLEIFMLTYLLEVCQEWGVNHGGFWWTLRVPDRRLGGQVHS